MVFESRVVSESPRKICRGIKDLNPIITSTPESSGKSWKKTFLVITSCVLDLYGTANLAVLPMDTKLV